MDIEKAWTEFKSALLPWILAAGVIFLMLHVTGQLLQRYESNATAQATQIEALSKAVESIRDLLAQQGYVVPPTGAVRPR